MRVFGNSEILEKALALVFILIFMVFSIFFSISSTREIEHEYNNHRLQITRTLAHEIISLIEKRVDVTAKLSNSLAEKTFAYAIVHMNDGGLLAYAESQALPVGIMSKTESEAIKTQYLTTFHFKDPSDTYSIVETAMPIFTSERVKYVLRIGFLKNDEEETISKIRFRNTLVFSLIIIFFVSLWFVRNIGSSNLKYAMVGSTTLVMLILFFATFSVFKDWYGRLWRQEFVLDDCIRISKMLLPATARYIETGDDTEFKAGLKILSENEGFGLAAVIKDEAYLFHTDHTLQGAAVPMNESYSKSMVSDKSAVFKLESDDIYEVMIPVLTGSNRIGTLRLVWRNIAETKLAKPFRNRLAMLFAFAYLVLYLFMRLFATEINNRMFSVARKNPEVSAGIPASITSDSSSQNEARQFAVGIYIYYSGITKAIEKVSPESVRESAKLCEITCEKLAASITDSKIFVNKNTDGIWVLFAGAGDQKLLINAVKFARLYVENINGGKDLCFMPKLTLNTMKLINVGDSTEHMIGASMPDYKTIAGIQSSDEIIVCTEMYNCLKDVISFEKLEVISPEQGQMDVYVLGADKDLKELINNYSQSLQWNKLLILRILENDNRLDSRILDSWAKQEAPDLKDTLLKQVEINNV